MRQPATNMISGSPSERWSYCRGREATSPPDTCGIAARRNLPMLQHLTGRKSQSELVNPLLL